MKRNHLYAITILISLLLLAATLYVLVEDSLPTLSLQPDSAIEATRQLMAPIWEVWYEL